ncbi:MAG: hypothetical protein LUG86_01855 [Oscillospiraceae bacterium]|nr:hypothetical protein [Oscillospiraceae bacterium]
MKKSLSVLLAILSTLTMAISVAAEDTSLVPEESQVPDASMSHSEESKEEPDCKPNCEAGLPLIGDEDY